MLKLLLALVFLFGLSAVRADDQALSSKVPCSCAELGEKLDALSREVIELKAKVEELTPPKNFQSPVFHTTEGKEFTNLHSEKLEALNREIFGKQAQLEELRRTRYVGYPMFDGHGVLSLFHTTEGKGAPSLHSEKLEALRREIFGQKAELEELRRIKVPVEGRFERYPVFDGVHSLFSSTKVLASQTPPEKSLSLSLYSSTLD